MGLHQTALVYFGLIALGFGVGAYGTLVGAGGGFILMPLLLLLYPHEKASHLTAISLAVVFINSLSGAGAYARLKRIDYKSGLLCAAATIPGAILGALITTSVPRQVFEAIFGVFLVLVAVVMFWRPKSTTAPPRQKPLSPSYSLTRVLQGLDGVTFTYAYYPILGISVFFFLGFAASFLGIGGGSLIVPSLAYLLNFPVFIATGTSQFIVAILTLTATVVHIWTGAFHAGAHRTAALGIGVLLGAQLGAYLSNKIKGAWIIRSLALALTLVGLKMLIAAFNIPW
jgi:uncharacterized membrane protein YfcA